MAVISINNVRFAGLAACVPKNQVSNLDSDPEHLHVQERLVKSTGICNLRVCDEDVTCSDLCFEAAQVLMKKLAWDASSVEALILVTQSGDYPIPSTAIILQDRLGLPKSTLAFDINLGCSGYPYGLAVLTSLMQTGAIKRALLMVGDKSANPKADRSVSSLFSDCGTVTALEFDEKAPAMHFDLMSDGAGFKAIYIPDGGCRNPVSEASLERREVEPGVFAKGTDVRLSGVDILNFAIREVPLIMGRVFERHGLSPANVDGYIFHQANKLINETIRKRLKLPEDKVPSTLYDFGNTSSASVPLTMVVKNKDALRNKRSRFVCCGFGVGLSWGTAVIETDHAVVPDLIEV